MPTAFATLQMDSDWATIQLLTKNATVKPVEGFDLPSDVVFTETGFLVGQLNGGLQPKSRVIEFQVSANAEKVTFCTGHGDSSSSPQSGSATVILANNKYVNNDITGDGLNIKVFYDAPLFS